MKCEIKCIENDFKEECKALGLKTGMLIVLIAFFVSIVLRTILGESIYGYFSITIALAALVYFALLGYFTWRDAVDYCKNTKRQEVNHG